MFSKITFIIIATVMIACGLLVIRQQRMQLANDIAQAHRQINHSRQRIWDLQAQVSQKVQPLALHQALERRNIEMEPVLMPTPVHPTEPDKHHQPLRVVDRSSSYKTQRD